MITVYAITYNEELLIQFMLDHYRERFPGCRIVVYDNQSTDNTVKIALANNCEVGPFDTHNQFSDRRHMEIKNSCWLDATTDWVLMCDLDELLDINEHELKKEAAAGTTIIKTEGYNMVTLENKIDLSGMHYGQRDEGEDKPCLFNKKLITEINYSPGAHRCEPVGRVTYSKKAYKLYHYCYINYSLTVAKYKIYAARKSPEDRQMGWGGNTETPAEIRAIYTTASRQAVKVR